MNERLLPRFMRHDNDANTGSPQRLSRQQTADLDALEAALDRRVPAIAEPSPLSPEAAALVNRRMIEKAQAHREETLATYQSRIDAAQKAYAVADEMTAKFVKLTERMAEENAKHIASINAQLDDLRAIDQKHAAN